MIRIIAALALSLSATVSLGQEDPHTWSAEIAGSWAHIDAVQVRKKHVFAGGRDELTGRPFVVAGKVGSDEALWRLDYFDEKVSWAPIVLRGRRVFAMTSPAWTDLQGNSRVVAVDSRRGTLLWEDSIPGGSAASQKPLLKVTKGTVIAIAWTRELVPEGGAIDTTSIRAYDERRGIRRWEVSLGGIDEEEAISVYDAVVSSDRLWVAGFASRRTIPEFIVHSYDLRDGALVWEDRFKVPAPDGMDAGSNRATAWSLTVQGRTLVVAGTYEQRHFYAPLLRAYDARTGDVEWTHTGKPEDDAGQIPRAILIDGTRIIVAWEHINYATRPLTESTRLASYDLRTGAVLAELPLDAMVIAMTRRGRTLLLGGSYHGTRTEPPAGYGGFVMGISARGGLARSWNVFTPGPVDSIDVAGRSAIAASSQFIRRYQIGVGR